MIYIFNFHFFSGLKVRARFPRLRKVSFTRKQWYAMDEEQKDAIINIAEEEDLTIACK